LPQWLDTQCSFFKHAPSCFRSVQTCLESLQYWSGKHSSCFSLAQTPSLTKPFFVVSETSSTFPLVISAPLTFLHRKLLPQWLDTQCSFFKHAPSCFRSVQTCLESLQYWSDKHSLCFSLVQGPSLTKGLEMSASFLLQRNVIPQWLDKQCSCFKHGPSDLRSVQTCLESLQYWSGKHSSCFSLVQGPSLTRGFLVVVATPWNKFDDFLFLVVNCVLGSPMDLGMVFKQSFKYLKRKKFL
jgi:hypothetical protein